MLTLVRIILITRTSSNGKIGQENSDIGEWCPNNLTFSERNNWPEKCWRRRVMNKTTILERNNWPRKYWHTSDVLCPQFFPNKIRKCWHKRLMSYVHNLPRTKYLSKKMLVSDVIITRPSLSRIIGQENVDIRDWCPKNTTFTEQNNWLGKCCPGRVMFYVHKLSWTK